MAIYEHSRYIGTSMYNRDNNTIFRIRRRLDFSLVGSQVHEFTEGETLDGIALNYYGEPHLWWVILEANKQYKSEMEIKYGDELLIPSREEVLRLNA